MSRYLTQPSAVAFASICLTITSLMATIEAFVNLSLALLLLIAFFVLSSLLGQWYYAWLLRISHRSGRDER